jgi:hypothetical protein
LHVREFLKDKPDVLKKVLGDGFSNRESARVRAGKFTFDHL